MSLLKYIFLMEYRQVAAAMQICIPIFFLLLSKRKCKLYLHKENLEVTEDPYFAVHCKVGGKLKKRSHCMPG